MRSVQVASRGPDLNQDATSSLRFHNAGMYSYQDGCVPWTDIDCLVSVLVSEAP